MQPYQSASQEIRRRDQAPSNALKKGGALALQAGSAYAGGATLSKVLPFLSSYIPQSLAIKGLSKVDPRFGKFITQAMDQGSSFDEVKEFIKDKAQGNPQVKEQQEEGDEDIILKFSPKLSKLVTKLVEAGHPIEEVEQIARSPGQRSAKDVEHMEKSLGMTFYDILRSVFGGVARNPPQGQQQQQPQQQMAPQQQMQQGQPQAQGQGQGQAALMAILQKLQQSRGQPQ